MYSNIDLINSEIDNDLLQEADEYLRKNRILELFEDLATALAFKRPENIEDFLIEQLKIKKEQGLNSGIFTLQEINNVFNLFNLKKEKHISKDRCIKAIQTMASSSFQFENAELEKIPDKVDNYEFIKLCEKILGFANKEI